MQLSHLLLYCVKEAVTSLSLRQSINYVHPLKIRLVVCSLSKGRDPLSDSVLRSDQSLQETTSGADRWNHFKADFIDPLHRFSAATDLIERLSQNESEGRGLKQARDLQCDPEVSEK